MPKPISRSYTVAVVDDDSWVLESLGNLLEASGYAVRLHASAQSLLDEGLNALDCLISDVGMPGMDGVELQRLAGAERPELPVILITARDDTSDAARLAPNNRGLLHKPCEADALLDSVKLAVQRDG